MKRLNRALLSILLLLLAVMPFVISSSTGIVDPFTHGTVASEILMLQQGALDFETSTIRYTPAVGVLVASLSLTTGITPLGLEYLPVAGLISIAAAVCLARALGFRVATSLLIAAVLSFRFFSPFLYSVWPHSFGYSLYLFFVAAYAGYITTRKVRYIPTMALLFLGIHFFSYNAELWAIGFLALAELGRFVANRRRTTQMAVRLPSALSLLGAFVALFLGFNQVVYGAYIPRISSLESEFTITFRYYLATLFRSPSPVPYAWIPPPSPFGLTLAIVAWFVLALFVVVPATLSYALNFLRLRGTRASSITPRALVASAFLGVWFVDIASYLPLGAARVATTRYLTLSLPFVIAPSVAYLASRHSALRSGAEAKRIDQSRVTIGCLVAILALSVVIFSGTVASGNFVSSSSHFDDTHAAATWLLTVSPTTTYVTSDHNTQGQFAIVFAEAGRYFFSNNLYTPSSFSQLVDPNTTVGRPGYFAGGFVVVNMALSNEATTAGGWVDFQPIAGYTGNIGGNPFLSRVYDDGSVFINVGS